MYSLLLLIVYNQYNLHKYIVYEQLSILVENYYSNESLCQLRIYIFIFTISICYK